MTGRRKRKGLGTRTAESWRRAREMHLARVAAAATPERRIRAATELAAAWIRRSEPAAAERFAGRVVMEIGRAVRDMERTR